MTISNELLDELPFRTLESRTTALSGLLLAAAVGDQLVRQGYVVRHMAPQNGLRAGNHLG